MHSKDIICIVGIYRSGTSMVSRLLNLCGLDLGSPEKLTEANKNNPLGYFENKAFNKINRALRSHPGKSGWPPRSSGEGKRASRDYVRRGYYGIFLFGEGNEWKRNRVKRLDS
jgi:hypothetical protein